MTTRSGLQLRPDDWQAGLCEPGKGGICPRSCFIGFDQFGRTNYRLNRVANNDDPLDMKKYKGCNEQCLNCCLLCSFTLSIGSGVYVGKQTHHVRKTYGIQGKYSEDIAQGIFCQPCSLIRNELEIRKREELRTNIMLMQAPMPLGESRFQPMYTMPVNDAYRSEPQMTASHVHENDQGLRDVPLYPKDQLPQIPSMGSPLDPFARRNQILTPITERDSSEDPRQAQEERENIPGLAGVHGWLQKQEQANGKTGSPKPEQHCLDGCKPEKKGKQGKKGVMALPGQARTVCPNRDGKKNVVIFPVDEDQEKHQLPGFERASNLVEKATTVLAEIDRNSPNLVMVQVQPGEVFLSEPPLSARLRRATVTDHSISADVQVPHTIHSPRSHSLSINIRVPDGRGSVQKHFLGHDPRVVQLFIEPRDHPIEADIRMQEVLTGDQQHSISLDPKFGVRDGGPRGHSLRRDELVEQILEEEGEVEMAEGQHGLGEDVKVDVVGEEFKGCGLGVNQRVDVPVALAREQNLSRDYREATPTSRAFAHGIHLDEKVPPPELQRLNVQHSLSQDRKVLTPSPGRESGEHDLHADDRVKNPALFPVSGHEMGDDVRVEQTWGEQGPKEHGIGEDERVDSPASGQRRVPEHLLKKDAKVSQGAHQLLEHFLEEDRKASRGSSRGSNQKGNAQK